MDSGFNLIHDLHVGSQKMLRQCTVNGDEMGIQIVALSRRSCVSW